jgi:hypothetical protein
VFVLGTIESLGLRISGVSGRMHNFQRNISVTGSKSFATVERGK